MDNVLCATKLKIPVTSSQYHHEFPRVNEIKIVMPKTLLIFDNNILQRTKINNRYDTQNACTRSHVYKRYQRAANFCVAIGVNLLVKFIA